MDGILLIGLAAGSLMIVSAFVQYKQKVDEEKRADKLEEKANQFRKKLESEQIKTKELVMEIRDLNSRIIDIQDKNTNLQNELLKYATSDSYCYIQLSPMDNLKDTFRVYVINGTKYPIKNVSAIVQNQDYLPKTIEEINKNSIHIGDIPGGTAVTTNTKISLDELIVNKYYIQYTTDTKHFSQLIRVQKHGGTWNFATRVSLLSSGEVLHEQIDDYFKNKDIFN